MWEIGFATLLANLTLGSDDYVYLINPSCQPEQAISDTEFTIPFSQGSSL